MSNPEQRHATSATDRTRRAADVVPGTTGALVPPGATVAETAGGAGLDAEDREHRRCMELVRRHLPSGRKGGPVEIGEHVDERGWRRIYYQWPDGTVVGPAGPFPPRR